MCNNCVNEIVNIQTGEALDWNKVNSLPDNAMLKVRPELWIEWDFSKNDEIVLDVWKVTKGSNKKVWWLCKDCGSMFDDFIYNKTKGVRCGYCCGKKVNETNSLLTTHPQIASQWHPSKNGDLTPNDVTSSSHTKVWWQCSKDSSHEWDAVIYDRMNNKNCPFCSNRKILVGYNDLWTTHPEVAKFLLNPDDGYKVTHGRGDKLNWKCPTCQEVLKGKAVYSICTDGLFCPFCDKEGISYPEKVMYHLLKQFNVKFDYDKVKPWSKNKRFDFYIPSLNMIIEMNGIQHSVVGFDKLGGRSVEEEQENDRLKYEMAKKNGIENYIVIDASQRGFKYIKTSILNSKITNFFDFKNVNWDIVYNESEKSFNLKIVELWDEGLSIDEIIYKLEYEHRNAYKIIFDILSSLGRLDELTFNNKIFQYTRKGIFIKAWDNMKEIENELGYQTHKIFKCCQGLQDSSFGFKWTYVDDIKDQ